MEIVGKDGWLLVGDSSGINLYETNKDPRSLKSSLNGISNPHISILSLQKLSDSLYLQETSKETSVIQLEVRSPEISCFAPENIPK